MYVCVSCSEEYENEREPYSSNSFNQSNKQEHIRKQLSQYVSYVVCMYIYYFIHIYIYICVCVWMNDILYTYLEEEKNRKKSDIVWNMYKYNEAVLLYAYRMYIWLYFCEGLFLKKYSVLFFFLFFHFWFDEHTHTHTHSKTQ